MFATSARAMLPDKARAVAWRCGASGSDTDAPLIELDWPPEFNVTADSALVPRKESMETLRFSTVGLWFLEHRLRPVPLVGVPSQIKGQFLLPQLAKSP